MAVLVFLALFFSLTGYSSATYCICKDGMGDSVLQKTIDYACGAGADCRAILQNGACFQPNTVKAHCDYAANSYFQNKGQAVGTCDFSGTATPSNILPSTVVSGCSYPTSAGQSQTPTIGGIPTAPGGTTTGGTTTGVPGTTTGVPGSTTTGIYAPTGLAPTGGITDVGPNGNSIQNHPGYLLPTLTLLLFPGLLLLWG